MAAVKIFSVDNIKSEKWNRSVPSGSVRSEYGSNITGIL